MRPAAAALALALAACGSFEDPAIVIDPRMLAVQATPPEQVVRFDPQRPEDVELTAFDLEILYADPQQRTFDVTVMACPPQRDLRCTDLEAPFIVVDEVHHRLDVGVGRVAEATVPGGDALTAIVRATIENDDLQGFGGVDINVSIRAVPPGGGEDEAIYAGKAVRFSAKIPEERVANRNPSIAELVAQIDTGNGLGFQGAFRIMSSGCVHGGPNAEALRVPAGARVKLAPREDEGSIETYVVPTFEGGSRVFTENLRYQWRATGGSFTTDSTGGPRDLAGNPPSVSTEWRPPFLEAGEDFRLVDLWIVQRDERGGASFFQACFVAEA